MQPSFKQKDQFTVRSLLGASMRRFILSKPSVVLLVSTLLLPTLSRAETPIKGGSESPVGIVTTISGQVTVSRGTTLRHTMPVLLKFRDEVYLQDQISTKEFSTIKLLLGGKSLVTVRELSVLTITEELGLRSTLHLPIGKVSIAVARQKMNPGETIEIRTPNATATVRGTVFIVEVKPALDYAMPSPAAGVADFQPLRTPFPSGTDLLQTSNVITTFHVLKGRIDIRLLAGPDAPPVVLQAGMSLEIAGTAIGRPSPIPSIEQLVKDLKSNPQFPEDPTVSKLDETLGLNTQSLPPLPMPPPVLPPMTDLEVLSSEQTS
jgi:hypothetical protein